MYCTGIGKGVNSPNSKPNLILGFLCIWISPNTRHDLTSIDLFLQISRRGVRDLAGRMNAIQYAWCGDPDSPGASSGTHVVPQPGSVGITKSHPPLPATLCATSAPGQEVWVCLCSTRHFQLPNASLLPTALNAPVTSRPHTTTCVCIHICARTSPSSSPCREC